jgi:hypothetical protein
MTLQDPGVYLTLFSSWATVMHSPSSVACAITMLPGSEYPLEQKPWEATVHQCTFIAGCSLLACLEDNDNDNDNDDKGANQAHFLGISLVLGFG